MQLEGFQPSDFISIRKQNEKKNAKRQSENQKTSENIEDGA